MSQALRNRIGVACVDNRVRVKIYDSIKKELLQICESRVEAAKFTGLDCSSIRSHVKNKTASKPTSNKLGLRLVFR